MEKEVDEHHVGPFLPARKKWKNSNVLAFVPKHFDFFKLIIVLLVYKLITKNRKKEKNEPTEIEKHARMKFG